MTEQKLIKNLGKLRTKVSRKPYEYTPEHAKTFAQSFEYYTNTNTINLINGINELLVENGWCYPSFLIREDKKGPVGITFIELFTKLFRHEGLISVLKSYINKPKNFKELDQAYFNKKIDVVMSSSFDSCKSNIFIYWKRNPNFANKQQLLDQIQTCYDKKLWIACLSTAFPILDHLIRTYFHTKKFDKDVVHLLTMFKRAGITSLKLKPGFDGYHSQNTLNIHDFIQNDLRLIGIGLSSFVDIASIYYQYYRKDFIAPESEYPLNRHAIIHAASSGFNTKGNAVKLLAFIDLTIELEDIFKILLKED